ncbi:isoaspartyl peptidase/L-asparaginase family protein [Sphingopyxis sp. 22461]|uniref:isoaspartyl peptidase/L-asparaginase family protein n=1 Tax=Sphingopyxis sp. 22461 TaxID=3453923 RepID=UPI003F843B06
MADGRWAIAVHGGACRIPPALQAPRREGCAAALEAGRMILERGGSALEAVKTAVCLLEDDPLFNAGRGSVANADGEVEMDAGIMDGATLDVGAVACVRLLYNPVEAAHAMLREPPVLLVGAGAEAFARSSGIAESMEAMRPATAGESDHDTVGCVARDRAGHVAAATSTGGLAGTLAGRVGDAPLPGCGFYAEDGIGAVSLSGDGEAIARTLLAARVMRALETTGASAAVTTIFEPMARLRAEAGVILLDRDGAIGIAHNSPHFAAAYAREGMSAVSDIVWKDHHAH